MSKKQFTGESVSYIFDGAGGMRDQLEQAILQKLQEKHYPVRANVTTIKASGGGFIGALTGTKEQCVVIEIDKEAQIAISNTTVGTYLYVEIYLMVQERNALFEAFAAMATNVFKQQKRRALFSAAIEASEAAFATLNLKQTNSGYKRQRDTQRSED